jgi:hypothetical protein
MLASEFCFVSFINVTIKKYKVAAIAAFCFYWTGPVYHSPGCMIRFDGPQSISFHLRIILFTFKMKTIEKGTQ